MRKAGPEYRSLIDGRPGRCVGFSKLKCDLQPDGSHIFYIHGYDKDYSRINRQNHDINLGQQGYPMDISGGSLDGVEHEDLPNTPGVLNWTQVDKEAPKTVFRGIRRKTL